MDIVGSVENSEFTIDEWYQNHHLIKRQFSVQAKSAQVKGEYDIEVLTLPINQLYQMQQEFNDQFLKFIDGGKQKLKNALILKFRAIQTANEQKLLCEEED